MTQEQLKEIHRVYNQIVVPQILDRETLFRTYYLINQIHTLNVNLCRHCITSYVQNHPLKDDIDLSKVRIIFPDEKIKIKEGQIILTGSTENTPKFNGDKRSKEYKEYIKRYGK